MRRHSVLLILAMLFIRDAAAANAAAGKVVFENLCSSCHTTVPNKESFGPSLAGLVGRRSGGLAGYPYSASLANAQIVWDAASLEDFLTAPTRKVPGTLMTVAVADTQERADLIAYLASLGTAPPTPAVAAASAPPAGPTQGELLAAAQDSRNWLYASKDFTGQRYVRAGQITPKNVAQLRPVCLYRSASVGVTQSNPLVYNGTLYFTVDETTIAIDATTCRQRWIYSWPLKDQPLSRANRGVALKDGRLVRGTPDGYLIALNMSDGSLLWSRKIADPKSGQYLSMPPLIFEDRVLYGPAGADWGAKNWIGAFSLESGEPLWRFNLIPDATEPGAESWSDKAALAHGGASLWTPLSLDAKARVVYLPVGNPAPDFYGAARLGSNLYTNSVVALDIGSGRLVWYRQFGPNDVHDRDLSQVSPIFEATIDKKPRKLIAVSGKDGLLRVLDRDSREQLYEIPITDRKDWDAAPTLEGVHSCPGLLGGMEWNGPAYDGSTNTLYVATVDWCGVFKKNPAAPEFASNSHYYGGAVTPDPRDQARGWLQAIDASTHTVRWKTKWGTPLVAGITATSGGLLFTGDLDNNFLGIDAQTGKTLYSFNTGGSVGGGVISYEVGGKQFVATLSGAISAFFGGSGPAAVVIFSLP